MGSQIGYNLTMLSLYVVEPRCVAFDLHMQPRCVAAVASAATLHDTRSCKMEGLQWKRRESGRHGLWCPGGASTRVSSRERCLFRCVASARSSGSSGEVKQERGGEDCECVNGDVATNGRAPDVEAAGSISGMSVSCSRYPCHAFAPMLAAHSQILNRI